MFNMNLSHREFVRVISIATALLFVSQIGCSNKSGLNDQKILPNFIIIFTDDQGSADLGVFGAGDIETPNIDRMAREGITFTNFYVGAPVCTPSRATLLTGCYPKRVSLQQGVLFPNDKKGLNPDERTIAELLKEKGYRTACIGKWHLWETV